METHLGFLCSGPHDDVALFHVVRSNSLVPNGPHGAATKPGTAPVSMNIDRRLGDICIQAETIGQHRLDPISLQTVWGVCLRAGKNY
jgi:hypothetical protein